MGTDETYFIDSKEEFISPIELSTIILKELKTFVHNDDTLSQIVITIPASFDSIQSNATKEAGKQAGFDQVILLQEPIAASLAFFNHLSDEELAKNENNKKWLVYDLGGGTFDIALVGIIDNDLKVIDHRGDNYLGGVDLDYSLVMDVILPKIIQKTKLVNLAEDIKHRKGFYEKLYYILQLKAEEAKKELSFANNAEVELTFHDEQGTEHDIIIDINIAEFNKCIQQKVQLSLELVDELLMANESIRSEITEIIMIGGSTYIPYVRQKISDHTGLKANYNIDPTTAVAVGAAFYAGTKVAYEIQKNTTPSSNNQEISSISIDPNLPTISIAFNSVSKDSEEYLISKCTVPSGKQHFYRVTRKDGGYDSGFKNLGIKNGEFVLLRSNAVNEFVLKIYDESQDEISILAQEFSIVQGLFSLTGQPLPLDICIEVDNVMADSTKCELIFAKNSILPISKTIYKTISRTIKARSEDSLIINLMEGNANAHPSANQVIGLIEVFGKDLPADLIKGTDVEIVIAISESRDITVKANLILLDLELNHVFSPTVKHINIRKLINDILEIKSRLQGELTNATDDENYEKAEQLQSLIERCEDLISKARNLSDDDISDIKYQLDEQKRKLAQQFYTDDTSNFIVKKRAEYFEARDNMKMTLIYHTDVPQELKSEFDNLIEKHKNLINKGLHHF